MTREEKIMKRLGEHYQFLTQHFDEDRIVGVFLQGSQNYELDYEDSDIDTKAIILPKLEDLILGKPMYSKTLLMENDEHIDVKDIRQMFHTIKKQNINFVELLFTDFKIVNEEYEELLQPIFDNAEEIARANMAQALNCINGMGYEKYKAMEHPYPSTMEKIEKFGYDPKQLHHILRMAIFMGDFLTGKPYKKCLVSEHNAFLLSVKKGSVELPTARLMANVANEKMKNMRTEYGKGEVPSPNEEALKVLDDVAVSILMKHLKS